MAGHGTDEHPHGADRLCEAGDQVYSRAVRRGRVRRVDAEGVPCLLELALLHPDPDDMAWLVPTSPQEVMTRLLRGVYDEVSESQRRVGSAVEAFERFTALGEPGRFAGRGSDSGGESESESEAGPGHGFGFGSGLGYGEGTALRVLDGLARIQTAMDEATQACTTEVLTVQPGGIRREYELSEGLHRALELRGRGVRMRGLYNHVARHGQGLLNYLELVGSAAEARTLDEVVERLILFDRTVAFIPANAERTVALEIRHPALVQYLVTVFDRLWRLAVPLTAPLPDTGIEGISHRERSIAALLAEGHQDAMVAERLGISVRTCRAHIARLSETLGAASRTQLGVRIAQAGLDGPPGAVAEPGAGPALSLPARTTPTVTPAPIPAPGPAPAPAPESPTAR
ncbi:helix-turn-helix transcriptional regulator [Streptomyces sp. ME02-8801-2C]|uniref:helix-turn-helix transcriptional regulator n=1 Tax=Streptomyces sp. ME02-8801-2C TaxID=3028680 RepID=UPI0029A970F0|nr:helix-turn-helix transcriptional regulator [Streptomyces sp. ME02-8801-2C]MDX3453760.1 helix-turn-helix transcriptional regulator [Streptomyces sp. ME02-8801-2C]